MAEILENLYKQQEVLGEVKRMVWLIFLDETGDIVWGRSQWRN